MSFTIGALVALSEPSFLPEGELQKTSFTQRDRTSLETAIVDLAEALTGNLGKSVSHLKGNTVIQANCQIVKWLCLKALLTIPEHLLTERAPFEHRILEVRDIEKRFKLKIE